MGKNLILMPIVEVGKLLKWSISEKCNPRMNEIMDRLDVRADVPGFVLVNGFQIEGSAVLLRIARS